MYDLSGCLSLYCDYFRTRGTGENPTWAVDYEAFFIDFRSVSGRK